MIGILLKNGYEATNSIDDADVIVINTCGFLEAARQESIETIQSAIAQKKPTAKVVATGCMVQSHKEDIERSCPGIHYLLGSGDVEGILKAVTEKEHGELVTSNRSYLEVGEVPRTLSTPQHYAYLKIAEGCRKRCSYCIIPEIKGPLKSKPLERVIHEMNALIQQGVKEIILIAQDLGDWGRDLGFSGSQGLVHLLNEIVKDTRDFKIRLLYVYPDEISSSLIDVMKNNTHKIIPYIDMPIQHANNELLKTMRRATTKEDIVSCIETLRKEIPEISIRTSIIVGFPGETEEQFQELCQFVQDMRLDNVGIFTYSKEEKSHSAQLPGHLPEEVKIERFKKLNAIQQKIARSINKKRYLGKKIEVVVEGYHPETQLLMRGRHDGQCPDIDGQVIINDGRLVRAFGRRYIVEITDISEYDLVGRVVQEITHESTNDKRHNSSQRKARLRIV